jgi:hypothetical protein
MTPREVARQVPWLQRGELTRRRNMGFRPNFEIISDFVMYPRREIETFVMTESGMDRLFLGRFQS